MTFMQTRTPLRKPRLRLLSLRKHRVQQRRSHQQWHMLQQQEQLLLPLFPPIDPLSSPPP
jgi:hypothetical protein